MYNRDIQKKQHQSANRGFTLVELIVSLGLFLFVLSISLGGLLHVVDMSRKTEAVSIALDNLNLAMEDMSRTMRQGYNYHCGSTGTIDVVQECPSGDTFFAFEPYYGDRTNGTDQIAYRLNGTVIEKSFDSGTTWAAITSPSITIDALTFYYEGVTAVNNVHSLVTILVAGTVAGGTESESGFTLQTSVAQRTLNR